MRYWPWLLLALVLLVLAFWNVNKADAEPYYRSAACAPRLIDATEAKLLPPSEMEVRVRGIPAQRLSDALSRRHHVSVTDASLVLVFVLQGQAAVLGFDYMGCPSAAGMMPVAKLNLALKDAGIDLLPEEPVPIGIPI